MKLATTNVEISCCTVKPIDFTNSLGNIMVEELLKDMKNVEFNRAGHRRDY
jgi:hypothetical protein